MSDKGFVSEKLRKARDEVKKDELQLSIKKQYLRIEEMKESISSIRQTIQGMENDLENLTKEKQDG